MLQNYLKIAWRNLLRRRFYSLLILREFLLALLIDVLIAFPTAFLLMHNWLQNFAYHIDINWVSFLYVGLSFVAVISLVVGFQPFKAALMNPVKSLRSE